MVEHLRAQALLPEGFALRAGKEDHLTTVREILSAAGRLHEFDVGTDQSPNEHVALLVELAALVGEELAGVRFEEIAPDPDSARGDESGGAEPYRLHAYADGKRYSLEATNYGDWYDFVAVLGLLNSLLRERGSSVRFLSLYVGDQWANVVFGTRGSLAELVKGGLLVSQGPESARELAQELELGAFGDED